MKSVTRKWVVRDAIEYVYTVRKTGKSEGEPSTIVADVIEQYAVCPGGGGAHMKGLGMLVGNFELNP